MASTPGSTSPLPFALEPGERLLWASRTSGTAGYPQWIITLATLGLVFGLGPISSIGVVFAALFADVGSLSAVTILVLTALPTVALAAAGLGLWLLPRTRLSHFMTSRRLVSRTVFGSVHELRLDQVRAVDRLVVHYRTRYGVREVVTDRLTLSTGTQTHLFGPSRDIDRVLDLIEHGVLTRWVDLATLPAVALPGLPALPAPAEEHEGFFLCATTRTEGDGYGPLFVGPRVIVRITEELPFHVLGRLYSQLAQAADGEAAELHLLEIVRLSVVGHFVELPRASTHAAFEGNGSLVFAGDEGQRLALSVPADAATRLKAYLARPRPESAPFSLGAQLSRGSARPAPSAAIASPSASSPAVPSGEARSAPSTRFVARGPDLEDTSVLESSARTVELDTLSASHRKELLAALASDRRVFFGPSRFFAEHRTLALVALLTPILTLVSVGTRYGNPCSPTQDPLWIFGYALGLLGPTYLAVAWLLHTVRARTLPFAPGIYVLGRDVVVARTRSLRIQPLAELAAVGSTKAPPLSSFAELTLWVEGEPKASCFVPAAEIEETVQRVEAAREAASRGAPVSDPLRELRRSDALEKASRARPAGDGLRLVAAAAVLSMIVSAALFPLRNRLSDASALASAGDDIEALTCYADQAGAESARVRGELIPHAAYRIAHTAGTVNALTDFLNAYPTSPDAEAARHEREELAWSTAGRDVWSLSAFVAAYPDSPHVIEARRLLPGLALANAREQNDVASLTNVIRTYPGTPEANTASELRHGRYVAALDSLRARGGRAEVLAYFERLFGYLESHDAPEVLVRFRAPSATFLTALDELLGRQNGGDVEPIAPSFSARPSRMRETIVYDRLQAGFRAVVDADVLPLDHGVRLPDRLSEAEVAARIQSEMDLGASPEELTALSARLHEDNDPPALLDGTAPEIRIDYEVVPTGDIYVLDGAPSPYGGPPDPPRRFAGFRIDFVVELRLGSEPQRPILRFSVTPPASMMVGDVDPSASTIYERLASAAFDQLGSELTGAFFGAP